MSEGNGDVKIRLVELFAGIGAFSAAFRNTEIPHETIAIAEIDPHAILAHACIHGAVPNLGDISLVESLPDCDLLTYSFPCQDISMAGRGRGFAKSDDASEQTRSGLLWEVERLLLRAERKPKYLIMENVDAILNTPHIRNFKLWVQALTEMGYTSSYAVLDASDYGVPQTRKRCFMVSALGDERLVFPPPAPDGRILADVLEDKVDDKYFLPSKRLENLEIRKLPPKTEGLILRADLNEKFDTTSRVYSSAGLSPCLTAQGGDKNVAVESLSVRDGELSIRTLTPLECWRLQGFRDSDYQSAVDTGVSPNQLYKQAGNSIAVPVVEHIFRAMFIDKTWIRAPTLSHFVGAERN